MPRKAEHKQLAITVTAEQFAVAQALSGDERISDYLRRLIADDARRQGVDWPDNLRGWERRPTR